MNESMPIPSHLLYSSPFVHLHQSINEMSSAGVNHGVLRSRCQVLRFLLPYNALGYRVGTHAGCLSGDLADRGRVSKLIGDGDR
jgi:uncharacterized membrane protein